MVRRRDEILRYRCSGGAKAETGRELESNQKLKICASKRPNFLNPLVNCCYCYWFQSIVNPKSKQYYGQGCDVLKDLLIAELFPKRRIIDRFLSLPQIVKKAFVLGNSTLKFHQRGNKQSKGCFSGYNLLYRSP